MSELWRQMGVIHWPLAFSMLAVVALTLYSSMRLYRPGATPDLLTKAWLDAILFWGGFAMIAGVLGTLVGMVIAAQSIEAMGTVSPSLVWGGVKVALISSALGTLILAAAALCWFGLQLRWRVLEAREVGDA
jgi:branched-subunit amino acid transport protein AzlD